jgi:hypothetical protein
VKGGAGTARGSAGVLQKVRQGALGLPVTGGFPEARGVASAERMLVEAAEGATALTALKQSRVAILSGFGLCDGGWVFRASVCRAVPCEVGHEHDRKQAKKA